MPSADPHNEPGRDYFGIPGRLLNGPTFVTVRQPDGSIVRMSYCRRHRCWHCMLIVATEDHIVTSPLPPISIVVEKNQGCA